MAIAELKDVPQGRVEFMLKRYLLEMFGNVADNGDGQFIVKSEVDGEEFVGQAMRKLRELHSGLVVPDEFCTDEQKTFSFTGLCGNAPTWSVIVIFQ